MSNTASANTHSFLDLSTAHITQAEMEALTAASGTLASGLPRVIAHEYGAFVNVPDIADDDEAAERSELYPNVQLCIDVAREQGCWWINFDADGGTVDELPTYSW